MDLVSELNLMMMMMMMMMIYTQTLGTVGETESRGNRLTLQISLEKWCQIRTSIGIYEQ